MFKNKLNTNTTKQRVSKPKVNLDKRFFFFSFEMQREKATEDMNRIIMKRNSN